MSLPRVAIVGGGLSGCIAALVMRSRGNVRPVILDASKRSVGGRLLGGRHADSGLQFMRPTDPRFVAVMQLLVNEKLAAPWNGRFGLLGSMGGGFLPREVIGDSAFGKMSRENADNEADDNGMDFCGLNGSVGQKQLLYVGTPSNGHALSGLCQTAGVEVILDAKVTSASLGNDGKWHLDAGEQPPFDAVLIATHAASFAADTVRSAVLPTVTDDPEVHARLSGLADALQAQRDERTSAVFSWSGYFAKGFSDELPFDAVATPSSSVIHFLARDASKPGRPAVVDLPGKDGDSRQAELWTAVSTPAFGKKMLAAASLASGESGDSDKGGSTAAKATELMTNEISQMLTTFYAKGGRSPPVPLHAAAKRWGAGFAAGTLDLNEECVGLEPWRLAIAGDFISGAASPAESAALSGMDAAERISKWFEPPSPSSKL